VTDHRWNGEATDPAIRPEHYEAVLFHSDDLADAGWEVDFTWEVPADLPSGLYAARLRAGEEEDHVPIVVRPPRTRATAEVGVLLPTFTYLAYANERQTEDPEALAEGARHDEVEHDRRDAVLAAHPEWGSSLYDTHPDGAGFCYSSARRPVTNMRPDYTMWAVGGPHGLGADLYLLDWLREKGFGHDVFTDHDLHYDGAALLDRYRVLITGSHPEYASARMLDALREYLDGGGRLMYLGGNGFYWVTSIDPANPHLIEMRRGHNGTRVWESAPGEAHHSSTGEQGGLWRYRGRDPNRLVGIGFAAQGFAGTAPGYERAPEASAGPIAELIFAGVEEAPFGEYGLVLGGAAGAEIDRADPRHGTPEHTVVLASSTGHGDDYQLAIEDSLLTTPGSGGTEHPDVRADITFTETPNDGAVFAAGAISWSGALSHDGYDNGVSRVTENALRAMLTLERWPGREGER
jgi:N,N-dimethylformamidase